MSVPLKKIISTNLINIPGWRTNRKLVVIESDDWGTVRMASKEAFNYFLSHQLPVDTCPYNSNDALESNEDLEALFEALHSVKDKNGNGALITANNIVANPDFEKIQASNFEEYFFEPFTETLKHYPSHDKVESLYREGIHLNIFRPQFHGREHINLGRWFRSLQSSNKVTRLAFSQSMFSIHAENKPAEVNEFLDALDVDSKEQLDSQPTVMTEGLDLFEKIWGFRSQSFIAPCYVWSSSLEPLLAKNGVSFIQGLVNQLEPIPAPGYRYKKKYHYQGQKNKQSQRYLIRNAFFEPTTNLHFDWVGDCLRRIEAAFRWNKPAIISAHRLNFIGFIREENRTQNLKLFKALLQKIIQRWPDTEFVSTDQLGNMMEKR